jgi:uncharacterized membrane protein
MPVRKFVSVAGVTLVMASLIHIGVVIALPRAIMVAAMARLPANSVQHSAPVTSDSRKVPRPSPDLLYSTCRYDVSKSPLLISASVPNTYWSVSFFDEKGDNFFVINDQQLDSIHAKLVLVRHGTSQPPEPGTRQVISPTDRGVVMFRTLIQGRQEMDRLIALQKTASCVAIQSY